MAYKDKKQQALGSRRHYIKNKAKIKKRAVEWKRRQYELLRQFKYDYLAMHPCIDCGESDPIVLQFDHRGNKDRPISVLVCRPVSLKRFQKEIAKCDVRCANCHTRRTAKDSGYFAARQKVAGSNPVPAINEQTME